jgi:hypothetical protein
MNTIKSLDGHVSMTKIGIMITSISSIAEVVHQAGLDLVPGSTIDEMIVRIFILIGGAITAIGTRDAISKIGVK